MGFVDDYCGGYDNLAMCGGDLNEAYESQSGGGYGGGGFGFGGHGYGSDGDDDTDVADITFLRPDGSTEMKSVGWARDNGAVNMGDYYQMPWHAEKVANDKLVAKHAGQPPKEKTAAAARAVQPRCATASAALLADDHDNEALGLHSGKCAVSPLPAIFPAFGTPVVKCRFCLHSGWHFCQGKSRDWRATLCCTSSQSQAGELVLLRLTQAGQKSTVIIQYTLTHGVRTFAPTCLPHGSANPTGLHKRKRSAAAGSRATGKRASTEPKPEPAPGPSKALFASVGIDAYFSIIGVGARPSAKQLQGAGNTGAGAGEGIGQGIDCSTLQCRIFPNFRAACQHYGTHKVAFRA